MEKTIKLGKVDGYGRGSANCDAEVDVKLADGNLSICGSVWKPNRSDIIMGGQCLDTLGELLPNDAKLQRIVEIWRRWHLNDMNAACEHQRANGFLARSGESVTFYNWRLTADTLKAQRGEKDAALAALLAGETVTLTEDARKLLGLSYSRKTHTDSLPDDLAPFYKLAEGTASYDRPTETKTLGWVSQSEHPDGLLGRPCEVCGYKYGTAWLKDELPPEVVAEVESW
jgi:hypothetical protein